MVQKVHHSRPESFKGAEVCCQQLASMNLLHCNAPLSKILYAVIQSQEATRVGVRFFAQVLEVVCFALVCHLCFFCVELVQQTLQCVMISLPNRFPRVLQCVE